MHHFVRNFLFTFSILAFIGLSFLGHAQEYSETVEQALAAAEVENYGEAKDLFLVALKEPENEENFLFIVTNIGILSVVLEDYETAVPYLDMALDAVKKQDGMEELVKILVERRLVAAQNIGTEEEISLYQEWAELFAERGPETAAQVWSRDEEKETLTHQETGIVFPIRAGAFERTDNHIYQEDGSDVSVGYKIKDKASMTIYISYYPGATLDQYADFSKESLIEKLEFKYKISNEISHFIPKQGDQESLGFYFFKLQLKKPKKRDGWSDEELWVANYGNWFVKIRITAKGKHREEIDRAFNGFLSEVDFGLNENIYMLQVALLEKISFCPPGLGKDGKGESLKGKLGAEMVPWIAITISGLLSDDKKGQENQICLYDVNTQEEGRKLVGYINQNKPDPTKMTNLIYKYSLFDLDWNLLENYEMYKAVGILGFVAEANNEKGGDIPPNLTFLAQMKDKQILIYDYYDNPPNFWVGLEATKLAVSGNSSIILEAVLEGRGVNLIIHPGLFEETEENSETE